MSYSPPRMRLVVKSLGPGLKDQKLSLIGIFGFARGLWFSWICVLQGFLGRSINHQHVDSPGWSGILQR